MPLYMINFYNDLFINTQSDTEIACVKTAGTFRFQKYDRWCGENQMVLFAWEEKVSMAGIYP